MFSALGKFSAAIVLGGVALGAGLSIEPARAGHGLVGSEASVECAICKVDPHHSMIPAGWKVDITSHPLNPKQSLYIFTANVLDEQGNGAAHAKVYLRVHTMDIHRVHAIRMENSGNGTYWISARVHTGDTTGLAVIIQP